MKNSQNKSVKLTIVKPNKGSQEDFCRSDCYETLYHGTRGPGKTMALVLNFLRDVGKGFGSDYKGILFRRKYKELYEIRFQFNKLFKEIYGNNLIHKASTDEFIFPGGEILKLAHISYPRDYYNYHGHAYAWLGFDELVSWASEALYSNLKSICRSDNKNIKTRIVCTTNSLGPGHNWVKEYFKIDQVPSGTKIKNEFGLYRTAIFGSILENKFILQDKNYLRFLLSQKDKNTKDSWLLGSWDIVAGGVISDLWKPNVHIVRDFIIPENWKVYRAMDWGSTAPYCVLFYAISNGEDIRFKGGEGLEASRRFSTRAGDVFIIKEIYGYGGQANVGTKETPGQVSIKIKHAQESLKKNMYIEQVNPGPADSQIFAQDRGFNETCIHDLLKPFEFTKCIKGAGSRVNGLELFRDYLLGAVCDKHGVRESKGIYISQHCKHTLRTVPVIPRCERNPEDADANCENHAYDVIRYILTDLKNENSFIARF